MGLRWTASDYTRQSLTGWWPADKPADGEGRLVARVAAYSGGEWRAELSRLGSRQPLTDAYPSAEDAIAAVETWLAENPGHLDDPRRKR